MPWYKVTVSDPTKQHSLEDAFSKLFILNGSRKDMAMFCDKTPRPTNIFYFSPMAGRLAHGVVSRFSGIECPEPSRSELALVVGDADWKAAIFPSD